MTQPRVFASIGELALGSFCLKTLIGLALQLFTGVMTVLVEVWCLMLKFGEIVTQRTKAPKLVYMFLSVRLTILKVVPPFTYSIPPNKRLLEEWVS